MAQKKVWLTWMASDDNDIKPEILGPQLAKNGLMVSGNHWVNDLNKMAWTELVEVLQDTNRADIWVIACDEKSFSDSDNRYALSLLFAVLKENRSGGFPVSILGVDFTVEIDNVPMLLRNASILNVTDAAWPAFVAASSIRKNSVDQLDYRFTVKADPMIGQWFEVGPTAGQWNGVMLGVTGEGEITHHAVGPKGVVPNQTTLNHQVQDMKATVAGSDFTIWSVKNNVGINESYFVKVSGNPGQLIFGGHPGAEDAEVSVITLT